MFGFPKNGWNPLVKSVYTLNEQVEPTIYIYIYIYLHILVFLKVLVLTCVFLKGKPKGHRYLGPFCVSRQRSPSACPPKTGGATRRGPPTKRRRTAVGTSRWVCFPFAGVGFEISGSLYVPFWWVLNVTLWYFYGGWFCKGTWFSPLRFFKNPFVVLPSFLWCFPVLGFSHLVGLKGKPTGNKSHVWGSLRLTTDP